jgi:hypothetical protein
MFYEVHRMTFAENAQAELSGNTFTVDSGQATLYHGSKGGIKGAIRPISRAYCDFGSGFYMGTDELQPLTLICSYPGAKLYTVQANLAGLRILDIGIGIDWALLIAYHRGKMENVKGSALYDKYARMALDCDIVIGFIANDRMFVVLDRFFSGLITDIALVCSLSALNLGKQYVALTDRACQQIEIVAEKAGGAREGAKLMETSAAYRLEGIRRADEISRMHRREGRFFDEIIEEGKA